MNKWIIYASALGLISGFCDAEAAEKLHLDVASTRHLELPTLETGNASPGKKAAVTPPEHAGSTVFHTLYLPENWNPDWQKTGERLPIIFEYAGNYHPPTGSTGEPEDAALGYGLSGGKYIWVSLPFVSDDHQDNAIKWWGDLDATVEYAKVNVPRIIETYGGDPNAVFLCGFSRGSIAVNYIGLHDDEIAALWSGFITHDHFDGAKAGGGWGSPLAGYQAVASNRLMRVAGRPYMVGSNGASKQIRAFIDSAQTVQTNFYFHAVGINSIFPEGFPNDIAAHAHTDRWLTRPSVYRQNAWEWMNGVINRD
ncbi:hypothetical protein [Pontiella sulfatireligans]|nr:hypothetical protein [Pontiella sulfatireligans]